MTGDATGSASFDGSGNISIDTTVTGGGAATLNELTDVDLATEAPVEGSYLRYDGTKWAPVDGSGEITQVLTPGITFPTIWSDVYKHELVITTSSFQTVGYDIHESTDWQISTDSDFNTIVFESINDATNKESIDLSKSSLVPNTTYYIRVKHNGVYDTNELWSSNIPFQVLIDSGEQIYTTPGTYSWICPDVVTNVSVVCVGGGGSGWSYSQYSKGAGGGGLGWKNNISVTAGQSYTVVVGEGGPSPSATSETNCGNGPGGDSYFINTNTVKGGGGGAGKFEEAIGIGGAGGNFVGDGGGNGGNGGANNTCCGGGGGAGGYSGNGGDAYYNLTSDSTTLGHGSDGEGGAGGAGGAGYSDDTAGSGGGVGLFGEGTRGTGGNGTSSDGFGGNGGSGGTDANDSTPYSSANKNRPGLYGGGTGASDNSFIEVSDGGSGAVRIIWGYNRTFPNNAA